VDTSGASYSEQRAARISPVTLYTGSDCIAECKLARDYLKRRGVPYREQQVKSVADAAALRQATGNKELLVPTIVIGKTSHQGFEAGAWSQLLGAAGYPLQGAAAK
ncbi:MAG TPA: glutaredoxin family protein, partial [Rhodocyclaceae bacterium]|nr:glutaredoxin family protein [Rhodocyclaceae bacterium]